MVIVIAVAITPRIRCCFIFTLPLNLSLIDIIAGDAGFPEDIIADAELLSALLQELEQLDARERRMLELASTVSEREAAKQMGIPRNTFAYQWAQLRARLAQNLKPYR